MTIFFGLTLLVVAAIIYQQQDYIFSPREFSSWIAWSLIGATIFHFISLIDRMVASVHI